MSDTDETQELSTATCLWCGADRPVDVDVCPACEHAWIDATIDEARDGKLDSVGPLAPVVAPKRRRRWVPFAIALGAAAVYGIVFWVMWDSTNGRDDVAATSPPDTVATTAAVSSSTTVEPTTTATATTPAPTTTTTTTTTSTTTTLPPIAVVEPPYDPADLTLGAFALGPVRIGSVSPDLPGRLAATFGQPTAQFPVGENWGMCPTESALVLEFGHLSVILRQQPAGGSFAGYRMQWVDAESEPEDPSASLRTISGLAIADSLSRANDLYDNIVTTEDEAGTPLFLVLRSADSRTLLWGELSAGDDPLILSINSPRPCDGGPFAP